MFDILNFIFNKKHNYANKINQQILNQSRRKDLFFKFQINDTLEKRLNFHILHLSLVMISLNNYKIMTIKNKILLKSIFKIYLSNFDLKFRELGLGDKVIEKKIFEISNTTILQYNKYKTYIEKDENLMKEILKNYFYNNNFNINIENLFNYIKEQIEHINSINLIDNKDYNVFIEDV